MQWIKNIYFTSFINPVERSPEPRKNAKVVDSTTWGERLGFLPRYCVGIACRAQTREVNAVKEGDVRPILFFSRKKSKIVVLS